jgi:hypothetical protein
MYRFDRAHLLPDIRVAESAYRMTIVVSVAHLHAVDNTASTPRDDPDKPRLPS